MKQYKIYKNIRKQALIMGLPVSMFAIMMLAVVGSLMFIIFSFSFYAVLGVFFINALLYVILIRLTHNPELLQIRKVFPKNITNKKTTHLNYEEN